MLLHHCCESVQYRLRQILVTILSPEFGLFGEVCIMNVDGKISGSKFLWRHKGTNTLIDMSLNGYRRVVPRCSRSSFYPVRSNRCHQHGVIVASNAFLEMSGLRSSTSKKILEVLRRISVRRKQFLSIFAAVCKCWIISATVLESFRHQV